MKDRIKALRAEAKKIEAEARAKLAEADKEKDAQKAADLRKEFETLMDKYDARVAEAAQLERSERARAEVEAHEEEQRRQAAESRRPTFGADTTNPEGQVSQAETYRAAFREFLAAGARMDDISAETRAALRAGATEARVQTGTTGATGGFTVPETLANFIEIAAAAHGPMWDANVATVMTTDSGATIPIPGVDDTASETDAHTEGNEAADDNSGDITIVKTDLAAYTRATPWIKWAFELAQDSNFSWESLLGDLIGERVGRTANRLLTVGAGTTEPLGFLTAAGVGFTALSQTVVTFDNLLELEHSVDPAYRANPKVRYQMHDQSVKAFRMIKDGNGRYVWNDGDVTKGVPATLNGKPVSFNQAMPQIAANATPVAFGDFSKYFVRKVGGVRLGVANEKFFPNLGMAGVFRFDGAGGNLASSAIKKLRMAA